MKKNIKRKGFTLTELLTAVVILGIIIGFSFPLINNIKANNNKRKYEVYMNSLQSSSKLYISSYDEDLFGHNPTGCAIVTFNMLENKKLIKDIEIEDMSCKSDNTFVMVRKLNNRYYYIPYLGCGKKKNGKADNISVIYPEADSPYVADTSVCSGAGGNTIKVDIYDDPNPDEWAKQKDTRIKITSSTGINSRINMSIAWSTSENPDTISDASWKKITIPVKGETLQEKSLEKDTSPIIAESAKIYTPTNKSGVLYLYVRVDNLRDLYGNEWKQENGSKYIKSNGFKIDNTPPTVPESNYYLYDGAEPTLSNYSTLPKYTPGTNTKKSVYSVPSNSTDTMSGLSHYEYLLSSTEPSEDETDVGINEEDEGEDMIGETEQFVTEDIPAIQANHLSLTLDDTYYVQWRACDNLGNCSQLSHADTVKIVTPPPAPTKYAIKVQMKSGVTGTAYNSSGKKISLPQTVNMQNTEKFVVKISSGPKSSYGFADNRDVTVTCAKNKVRVTKSAVSFTKRDFRRISASVITITFDKAKGADTCTISYPKCTWYKIKSGYKHRIFSVMSWEKNYDPAKSTFSTTTTGTCMCAIHSKNEHSIITSTSDLKFSRTPLDSTGYFTKNGCSSSNFKFSEYYMKYGW